MKKNRVQSGFSLLEMVVAAALTVGLMATIFQFLKQGVESSAVESTVGDLNQNFRAALDLVSRDLQSAGAGMPRFLGPILGKDGGVSGGNQQPDTVMVVYGKSTSIPARVNTAVTSATASFAAMDDGTPVTYTIGDKYIVYTPMGINAVAATDFSDFAEFEIFKVTAKTAISGGTQLTPNFTGAGTFSPSNWASWSQSVREPSASDLRVIPLDETIEYTVDKATNKLLRRKDQGSWVEVARGISDLQIQYRIEVINAATIPVSFASVVVDQPLNTPTNNRALIRGVIVTLTGTTEMQKVYDGQGQRKISQTVEIAPRNMVLTGLVPNR
jgi:type II secretory pathway pseudopilin PulG